MKTTKQKLNERERQHFANHMKSQRDPATGKVFVFYEGRRVGCFKNKFQALDQGPEAVQQMKEAQKGRSKLGNGYRRRNEVRTTAMTSGRTFDNVRFR